ncbi:hypothetical protein KZ829_40975 [Actinoplanes hulinensis]|uniref:Uncharacterized protein n=1 Tax=Actinoplanes hulinensis TaxID=1144547 RepID=A0ABS7BGV0_9ACTN|nr:hypothetical protein [Actinoplanes hulinensis]MBW6440117.1 hypothetical protein [Actinoplanes hulinensis]
MTGLDELAVMALAGGARTERLARVSAWGRGLRAMNAGALTRALEHMRVENELFMGSLPLIADRAGEHRAVLARLAADVRRIPALRSEEVLASIARTQKDLEAIVRRAATPGASLVSSVLRGAATEIPAVSSSTFTWLVRAASLEADAVMHARLTRLFRAGPLGDAAWIRLATAIEGGGGRTFDMALGQVSELLAIAHPGYRQTIGHASGLIGDLGMRPVEFFGDSWIVKAGRESRPLRFRDGGLLAVREPASVDRIGEAGIVTSLESKQAATRLEALTVDDAARRAAGKKLSKYDPSLEARRQQISAARRTEESIAEGDILMTSTGEFYHLRPVPQSLIRNVVSRPYLMSGVDVRAITANGRNVVQVTTPFNSEFLRPYIGRLLRAL